MKKNVNNNLGIIVKRFEILVKERDVSFFYDHEDGYFIKVSDKGSRPKDRYSLAEIDIESNRHDLPSAMRSACDWMEKQDEDYANILNRAW